MRSLSDLYLLLNDGEVSPFLSKNQVQLSRFIQEILILNNSSDIDVSHRLYHYPIEEGEPTYDLYIDFIYSLDKYECTVSVLGDGCIILRYEIYGDGCDYELLYGDSLTNKAIKSLLHKFIISMKE